MASFVVGEAQTQAPGSEVSEVNVVIDDSITQMDHQLSDDDLSAKTGMNNGISDITIPTGADVHILSTKSNMDVNNEDTTVGVFSTSFLRRRYDHISDVVSTVRDEVEHKSDVTSSMLEYNEEKPTDSVVDDTMSDSDSEMGGASLQVESEAGPEAITNQGESSSKPLDSREVAWEQSIWGIESKWIRDPSIEAIDKVCRRELKLDAGQRVEVKFLAQGAFNKVYAVQTEGHKYAMRVALPLDPGYKTRAEITTLKWIRQNTSIPVAKIYAFNQDSNDEIGYDWLLQEFMPGQPVRNRWRKMTMGQKVIFTMKIAEYRAEMFTKSHFRGIGAIYDDEENMSSDSMSNPSVGRIVDATFYDHDHYTYDVARGPYHSSHDWMGAYMRFHEIEYQRKSQLTEENGEPVEEEDIEVRREIVQTLARLRTVLPKIFAPMTLRDERTVIDHLDLSINNILVDDDGDITAVLDWENVQTVPLWAASNIPEFLRGPDREVMPQRDGYGDADPQEENGREEEEEDPDKLDDEGKTPLYWNHLAEYELTQLRKVYHYHMAQLWAPWKDEVEDRGLKADFWEAVINCSEEPYFPSASNWLDALEKNGAEGGSYTSLRQIMLPEPVP